MVNDRGADARDGLDGYRTSMTIDAAPEHVYRFWVEPELLASWIGISARVDPRPGGEFRFEITPGEWCAGRYVELDPPRRVVLTWGWEAEQMGVPPGSTRVEVDLAPVGSGTRLELVHHSLSGDALRLHADGWPRFLARLALVGSGAAPGAKPTDETAGQALERMERSS